MLKTHKFTLLLSLLSLFSCLSSVNNESKISTQVSANINTEKSNKVIFILENKGAKINDLNLNFLQHDSLFFGTPFKLLDSLSIDLSGPDGFIILSDKSQAPIWVSEGDSIYFSRSEADGSVVIRSNNKQRNDFITFMQEVIRKHGAIFPFVFDLPPQHRRVNSQVNINLVETEINKLKQDRLKFLQEYHEKFTMSDSALKKSNDFINIAAVNDSILLYQNNRKILRDLNLFTSKLSVVSSSASSLGFEGSFPYYFANSNLVNLAANIQDILDNRTKFDSAISFISKNIQPQAKDFLLSRYVYLAIMNDIIAKDHYQNFVKLEMPYSNFLTKKVTMLNHKQDLLANGSYLNSKSNNPILLKDIIDKHKGKVILIDFWASWCQPCIAEFPNSNKLLERYSEKEFSILYFSIDQDMDKWQQAVEKYKLNMDNSYLVGGDNKLLKELQIKSIPRYVLLDTNGNIWNANAPRPGSKEILNSISLLLRD